MNNNLLRVFETESDYDSAKPDFVYPTVSYVRDVDEVKYMETPLAPPFYIEALADGMTVTLDKNDLEYSTDLSTWSALPMNTASPAINNGEKIYLRGNATVSVGMGFFNGIGRFTISQSCNIGGNIMSLLFNDDFEGKTDFTGYNQVFYRLFMGQPIVNASELILPATTLANSCYSQMFYGCTSLTTAPRILPATTLTDSCYTAMFQNCTSLNVAPELLATTLAYECCKQMFYGCTSLTTAPRILPATTLAEHCYSYMFGGCTSLTTAPALPATTLAGNCYDFMFRDCTSLTTAPALPATTLANNCYLYMFYGCSNLNYIKMLATDVSAGSCLSSWVNGVSATGTFVKNSTLSEETIGRGVNGIPEGWTVVDA